MKLVYLAGPYRSTSEWGVLANIARAHNFARLVAIMFGDQAFPVTPHLNSAFMGGVRDDDYFLAGDLELLKRCDVLFVFGDKSEGVKGEIRCAKKNGIPIVYNLKALGDALKELEKKG